MHGVSAGRFLKKMLQGRFVGDRRPDGALWYRCIDARREAIIGASFRNLEREERLENDSVKMAQICHIQNQSRRGGH